jgi:predicted DNA-binding protein YlxM (UPF0122 family)
MNYEWLVHKYCNELLTTSEIAKLCNLSEKTICYHLRKAGIKPRGIKSPRAPYKDRKWLLQKYLVERKSIGQIAKECNVSKGVIWYNMVKMGIARRRPEPRIRNGMKECTICKRTLPLGNFWRKPNSVDGYWHQCKECLKRRRMETARRYLARPEVRERMRQIAKEWDRKNRERRNMRAKKYRDKIKNSISFRLNNAMRSAIYHSLKGNKNGWHWEELAGYTVEDLRKHIESLWEPWMNWDNWGKYDPNRRTWQIDHIKPVSSFNITGPECEDFKQCWALENLRPVPAIENILKKDRVNLVV